MRLLNSILISLVVILTGFIIITSVKNSDIADSKVDTLYISTYDESRDIALKVLALSTINSSVTYESAKTELKDYLSAELYESTFSGDYKGSENPDLFTVSSVNIESDLSKLPSEDLYIFKLGFKLHIGESTGEPVDLLITVKDKKIIDIRGI